MSDDEAPHFRELEFNAFIEQLRSYTEIPTAIRRGEIAKRIVNLACQGCNSGKECINKVETKCYNCELCCENYEDCLNKKSDICNDCFNCGCVNCRPYSEDYDGCDIYPPQVYSERLTNYLRKMVSTLKESPIPFDKWAPYIDDTYLSDSEKRKLDYILNPPPLRSNEEIPEIRPYATNYNILRIMAGLPGLDYRD